MNTDQILKVLRYERDFAERRAKLKGCDKKCESCERECLPDTEILEVYDFLISGYELLQNESAESYTIKCKEPLSKEQIERFKEAWGNASLTTSFEPVSLPDNMKAVILEESSVAEDFYEDWTPKFCPKCGSCIYKGEKAVTGHCIRCHNFDQYEKREENDNAKQKGGTE